MSFIFSQQEPRRFGRFEGVSASAPDVIGAAFGQGVHYSVLSSIYRMSELNAARDHHPELNPYMSRDVANEEASKLGLPLVFDTDPTIDEFNLLVSRKKDEIARQTLLSSAKDHGWGTKAGVFGATMLGSVSNPTDLATMFLPIVGTGAKTAPLAKGASVAQRTRHFINTLGAKGLITTERSLSKTGVPTLRTKMAASSIEGAAGMMIAEVPVAIAEASEQSDYTSRDFFTNVAAGAAFGAAFRGALEGVSRLVGRMSSETRANMEMKAMEDFLRGDDIEVHQFAELDKQVLYERMVERRKEDLKRRAKVAAERRRRQKERLVEPDEVLPPERGVEPFVSGREVGPVRPAGRLEGPGVTEGLPGPDLIPGPGPREGLPGPRAGGLPEPTRAPGLPPPPPPKALGLPAPPPRTMMGQVAKERGSTTLIHRTDNPVIDFVEGVNAYHRQDGSFYGVLEEGPSFYDSFGEVQVRADVSQALDDLDVDPVDIVMRMWDEFFLTGKLDLDEFVEVFPGLKDILEKHRRELDDFDNFSNKELEDLYDELIDFAIVLRNEPDTGKTLFEDAANLKLAMDLLSEGRDFPVRIRRNLDFDELDVMTREEISAELDAAERAAMEEFVELEQQKLREREEAEFVALEEPVAVARDEIEVSRPPEDVRDIMASPRVITDLEAEIERLFEDMYLLDVRTAADAAPEEQFGPTQSVFEKIRTQLKKFDKQGDVERPQRLREFFEGDPVSMMRRLDEIDARSDIETQAKTGANCIIKNG